MKTINTYINEKLVINKNSINKYKLADAKNVDTWQVGDIFYWQNLGADEVRFAKIKAISKTDITCDFLDSKENNGEYTPTDKIIYNDGSFYLTKTPNNITVCKFGCNNFAKLWDGSPVKATIDEKLIINKDSINNRAEKEYTYITDKYDVGDKCLFLFDRGLGSQERVLLDVVEITKRSKTKISYKFLTNTNNMSRSSEGSIAKTPREVTINKGSSLYQQAKYMNNSTWSSSCMVIPEMDSLDVLDEIINNDKKIDYFSVLWGDRHEHKKDPTKVMQKKEDATDDAYSSYETISDENLKLIREML